MCPNYKFFVQVYDYSTLNDCLLFQPRNALKVWSTLSVPASVHVPVVTFTVFFLLTVIWNVILAAIVLPVLSSVVMENVYKLMNVHVLTNNNNMLQEVLYMWTVTHGEHIHIIYTKTYNYFTGSDKTKV